MNPYDRVFIVYKYKYIMFCRWSVNVVGGGSGFANIYPVYTYI